MIRILGWIAAAMLWGVFSFVAGLYLTFPSDVVRARIEHQSAEASDHDFQLSPATVAPWWFTGVKLSDVSLYSLKRGRIDRENPATQYDRRLMFVLDSLAVRVQPTAFLFGGQGYSFAGVLFGGDVDGSYQADETSVGLAFDLSDVDFAKMPISTDTRVINLTGVLAGNLDLHVNLEALKESTGTFLLSASNFGIGSGSTVAGFALPEAPFSKASLAAEVESGKLIISEGVFEGSVMSATLTGEITLNKKLLRSRDRFDIAFTLPEEFESLAAMSQPLTRSKDPEGRYHCQVTGTLMAPSFRCGKASPARSPGTISALTTDDRKTPIGDIDPDMSDEDRRAAREDRIKERRERLKKRREDAAKKRGDLPPVDPDELRYPPRDPVDFPPDGMDLPMGRPDMDFPPGPPDLDREFDGPGSLAAPDYEPPSEDNGDEQ